MKLLLAAITLFMVISVPSQTTTSEEEAMDSQINQELRAQPPNQNLFTARAQKPNEREINGVTYSGILVQLATTDQPLELINPFAGPEYGSAADNTVLDPITGNASGLKLFSIQF